MGRGNLFTSKAKHLTKRNMSKTANEQIAILTASFNALSKSRKSSLKRQASFLIGFKPHMADASNFWRGLSARQIIAS